jgi:hypothetical protein
MAGIRNCAHNAEKSPRTRERLGSQTVDAGQARAGIVPQPVPATRRIEDLYPTG